MEAAKITDKMQGTDDYDPGLLLKEPGRAGRWRRMDDKQSDACMQWCSNVSGDLEIALEPAPHEACIES